MTVYGEVSWGDTSTDINQKSNNNESWMRLEKGSNVVRIVTAPHQYLVHRYKREGDPGYGTKINCSSANGSCAVCQLNDKPKRRWLLGVIDRKTGAYKILDIGILVFKAVQELTRSDDWGTPDKYDIDIKVDPNGGATNYYSVMPKLPKPLTAADIQIKDMVDLDELKRRCTPPMPDKVQERLDRALSGGAPVRGSAPAPTQAKAAAKPSTPKVDVSNSDEDDDVSFPSYEAKV